MLNDEIFNRTVMKNDFTTTYFSVQCNKTA